MSANLSVRSSQADPSETGRRCHSRRRGWAGGGGWTSELLTPDRFQNRRRQRKSASHFFSDLRVAKALQLLPGTERRPQARSQASTNPRTAFGLHSTSPSGLAYFLNHLHPHRHPRARHFLPPPLSSFCTSYRIAAKIPPRNSPTQLGWGWGGGDLTILRCLACSNLGSATLVPTGLCTGSIRGPESQDSPAPEPAPPRLFASLRNSTCPAGFQPNLSPPCPPHRPQFSRRGALSGNL